MSATLLIVDDEPRIFGALRRALHREPLRLLQAESGEEALRVLESESVDVILADENMPGMNGSRLLAEVSRRWPATVRMMLTGTADMDVVCKAVNEGRISRIFTKPCNEAELIIAIRDALADAAGPSQRAVDETDEHETTPPTLSLDDTEDEGTHGSGHASTALRLVGGSDEPEGFEDGDEGARGSAVIELDDADDVAGILADLDQLDRMKH